MNKISTLLILLSAFTLMAGCSDAPNKNEARATETLPAMPERSPKFVNTSSLQNINEVAMGDLSRASQYTEIDFAMAVLDQLPEGYSPETAAAELFDNWQVGSDHNGRGVLYLFIEEAGVLKIEVGYELEELFPDAFVASFQQTLKDYYLGEYFGDVVSSMIITMMRRAQGESEEATLSSFLGNLPATPSTQQAYLSGGAGVTESQFIRNRTERANRLQLLSEAERAKYNRDRDVEVVLKRYLDSLKQGINDPYLPLLTRGSQFMRMEYPKNASFQRNAYRDFSGSYTIQESGDYAAVRFDRPDVMPILFRKDAEGHWLADITKSWAYSQATNDLKQMNPAYGDHAWIFAWPNEFHQPEIPATPAPLDKHLDLETEITRLENAIESQPGVAANYFRLADIFYYECYWIRDAMTLIERGLEIEPGNNLYRKRYIDFAYRFPDLSKVGEHYAQIYQYDPGDFRNLWRYRPYLKRHKPKGYEAIIQETEAVDKKRPLPNFPFYSNNNPGKFSRRGFELDPEKRMIEIGYQVGPTHWHDKYTPRTMIYLYDEQRDESFGLTFIQSEPTGSFRLVLAHGETEQIIRETTLGADGKLRFQLRWNPKNTCSVWIEGREVLHTKTRMHPNRIVVEQRSGSCVVEMKYVN